MKSGWRVVALDAVGLVLALVVFALFHHVLPVYGGGAKKHIVSVGTAARATLGPAAQASNTPEDAEARPAPLPTYAPGDFSATFPGYDTGAGKYKSYQSDDVRIAVDMLKKGEVTGYIADIWIRNISYFQTAFAKNQFGRGIHEMPLDMADRSHAVLAISGDYYGSREKGVVIRNGDPDTGETCERPHLRTVRGRGTMKVYDKGDLRPGRGGRERRLPGVVLRAEAASGRSHAGPL